MTMVPKSHPCKHSFLCILHLNDGCCTTCCTLMLYSYDYSTPPPPASKASCACQFPFSWGGISYYSCTSSGSSKPWCKVGPSTS